MHIDFKEELRHHGGEPIPQQLLMDILKAYRRPHDKIHELVRSGNLTPIRRGLFVPGPHTSVPGPDPLLLANHILGPSYVSLETALSFWGLIPERVFGRVSVTPRAGRRFDTPLGRFTYLRAPLPYYSFGIMRASITDRQAILMATPEKALCDKVALTADLQLRSVRQAIAFLRDDLRIDAEDLSSMRVEMIEGWLDSAPKASSLGMLVKAIEKL